MSFKEKQIPAIPVQVCPKNSEHCNVQNLQLSAKKFLHLQWLEAPRPHPSLLLGGPACRSPGVTRFKPFQRFNILLACLIPRPTSTPRPHQWLLMGVQACRLPAFKPLKPLKPSKSLTAPTKLSGRKPLLSQRCSLPFACIALCCWGVQACRLPAFKPLKPLKLFKPLRPSKSLAAASTKPSGRKPLLFQRCSPQFACVCLHSPLLLGRLPAFKPLFKPLKPLKPSKSLAAASTKPSLSLSSSLSLQDPPNRGGRRHQGASPFYIHSKYIVRKTTVLSVCKILEVTFSYLWY